jgi:putative colanic acid biosynthesis UDP-glucose lipid carrier transferase
LPRDGSRSFLVRSSLCGWFTPLLTVASHTILRQVRRALWTRGINTRPFAVVGVNELGFQLARNIEQSPELGLKLAGFYDDRPEDRNPNLPPGLKTRIGGIEDLLADAKTGFVSRIYITFPMGRSSIRGSR